MADYVLPDLPYDYGALAPHISGEIMELHHDKHHAAYVKGVNTVLDQLAEAERGAERDRASWQARRDALALGLTPADGAAAVLAAGLAGVLGPVADRITVMVNGSVIASGTPDAVRTNRDVQAAYLGGH